MSTGMTKIPFPSEVLPQARDVQYASPISTASPLITEQPLRKSFTPTWPWGRAAWPESAKSTGRELEPLGRLHGCWETVGPALDILTRILSEVRNLLELRHECLTKDEPIIAPIVFGLYMTGRRKDQANPTLLFSCTRSLPRKRAKELVKESRILEEHPAIRLADSKRPPQALRPFRVLVGETRPFGSIETRPDQFLERIYFISPAERACGVPVLTRRKDGVFRKTTIGGTVIVGDIHYGITVAHAFLESDSKNSEDLEEESSDIECEFDDDSESAAANPVNQMSPLSNPQMKFDSLEPSPDTEVPEVLDTWDSPDVEMNKGVDDGIDHRVAEHKRFISKASSLSGAYQSVNDSFPLPFGQLVKFSAHYSVDWALIKVYRADPNTCNAITLPEGSGQKTLWPRAPCGIHLVEREVFAITGDKGVMYGTLSRSSTYMRTAHTHGFQELWTVYMKSDLVEGDCGSWVVDRENGQLYGHIVAGHPGTGVGYIVPASQIFESVFQLLGKHLTLPVSPTTTSTQIIGSDSGCESLHERKAGFSGERQWVDSGRSKVAQLDCGLPLVREPVTGGITSLPPMIPVHQQLSYADPASNRVPVLLPAGQDFGIGRESLSRETRLTSTLPAPAALSPGGDISLFNLGLSATNTLTKTFDGLLMSGPSPMYTVTPSHYSATQPFRVKAHEDRPAKRPRASKPKIKSGCITCKIRRVKCDETRPGCLRCLKFGRICDGYAPSPDQSQGLIQLQSRIPSVSLCSHTLTVTYEESQYFQTFSERTAHELPGFFDPSFWTRLVPQESHNFASVRHAVIAIGALSKALERAPRPSLKVNIIQSFDGKHHEQAVLQHLKAIQSVQCYLSSSVSPQLRNALIACLLFVCFEIFQGSFESSLQQIQGGLKILRNYYLGEPGSRPWIPKRAPGEDSKRPLRPLSPKRQPTLSEDSIRPLMPLSLDQQQTPAESSKHPVSSPETVIPMLQNDLTIEELLIQTLVRLDRQDFFLGITPKAPPKIWDIHRVWHLPIPSAFTDFHAAHRCWDFLMDRVVQFYRLTMYNRVHAPASSESQQTIQKQYGFFVEQLSTFTAAYRSILEGAISPDGTVVNAAALVLSLHQKCLAIALSFIPSLSEMIYDSFLSDFQYLVKTCARLIEIQDSAQLPKNPRFSLDIGIIPPLYLTATKCRDPTVRREAINLLFASPRQEGIWDSVLCARIGTFITSFEEDGFQPLALSRDKERKLVEVVEMSSSPSPAGETDGIDGMESSKSVADMIGFGGLDKPTSTIDDTGTENSAEMFLAGLVGLHHEHELPTAKEEMESEWKVPERNRVQLTNMDFHIQGRYVKAKCEKALLSENGTREERESVIAW